MSLPAPKPHIPPHKDFKKTNPPSNSRAGGLDRMRDPSRTRSFVPPKTPTHFKKATKHRAPARPRRRPQPRPSRPHTCSSSSLAMRCLSHVTRPLSLTLRDVGVLAVLLLELRLDLGELGLVEGVEVGVLQRLSGVDALGGVVHQHLLQQVDAVRVQLRDHLVQVLLLPLRELVPVAQARHARPQLLVGRAQQLEDVQQLLQLAVAGEQRLLAGQLGEDAPHGPHIDGAGVLRAAQQQLRRAVPPRRHVVRPEHRGGAVPVERRASQPEVANLELAVGVG
mmetsp:Transcript_36645/g.90485  ORF Transcript_36645/g.90485 Transcript_36645/m.90485 type:complete len:280 (+) Transcript_36645:895-1734(+)